MLRFKTSWRAMAKTLRPYPRLPGQKPKHYLLFAERLTTIVILRSSHGVECKFFD
jgi:hypothetical protein